MTIDPKPAAPLRRRVIVAVAGAATALSFVPWTVQAQSQPLRELNFGIISTESTQNLKQAWQPMLDDMGKRLNLKLNAYFASDYAGIIEAMRFNKVQVAWYGNKSAMEAVDRAQGEVFVQTIAKDGAAGYWSLLVVHRDSPLKSIEDVVKNAKSLTLGFGDPNSTSGFLVPGYYAFAQNNLDPRGSFKLVRSANHETNLLAVANKQVDLATNNNESLDRLKATNPQKAAELREIWRSPLIPSDPIVWRADLNPDTKAKVKAFFVDYGNKGAEAEREKKVLDVIGLSGFKDSDNRQLLPIRQLELFRDKGRVQADAKLSPAEKEARLAEINRKLTELNQQMAAAGKQ